MVGIIIIIITMVENQEVSKHVRVLSSKVCEPPGSILNTLISSCYY